MTTSDIFANQRQVWKDYNWFYPLVAGLVILTIGVFIGHFLIDGDRIQGDYGINLYTEVVSIIATVLILDRLADRRRKQEKEKDLQQSLIRDAGSTRHDIAIKAIEDLRTHGWLTGENGLLKEANLEGANLSGANLHEANLERAGLMEANLSGANLWDANLENANLGGANLEEADLIDANLKGADLGGANLEGADLMDANLQKAYLPSANLKRTYLKFSNLSEAILWNANLEAADLIYVNFDRSILIRANLEGANVIGANLNNVIWSDEDDQYLVTLPDGSRWTPDADMTLFTDPNHPEFWQPDEASD